MNDKVVRTLSLVLVCTLLLVLFSNGRPFCARGDKQLNPSLLYEPDHYGTVYIYPYRVDEWEAQDRPAMQDALQQAKDHGFDTVIQTFPSLLVGTGDEDHWHYLLDVAETVGVDIIAYMWPNRVYPSSDPEEKFDFADIDALLAEVGDEPALVGLIGLHEPLEIGANINEQDLRDFYNHVKARAPHLDLAHYLGDVVFWDTYRTDWSFTAGMCDICIIWYYPFRYIEGEPVYENDMISLTVQPNLSLIGERDPDAEVWFLGQAFADASHPRVLRMPTSQEMQDLYLLIMQSPIDGFMWYPWNHTEAMADVSLADVVGDQREMASEIPEQYIGHADLHVVQSVSFDGPILYPAETVTYTITYLNAGSHLAEGVVLTDYLPFQLHTPTIVDVSGADLTPLQLDGPLVWAVEPLDVGQGGAITFTCVIDADLQQQTIVTNTVSISAPIAYKTASLTATLVLTIDDRPRIYMPFISKNP